MNNEVNVKVGEVVNVVFSTGDKHPLSNKVVPARITLIGGYNGKCIEAETLKPVHHPEDPKGILVFNKNGKFLRYEVRPAYDKVWKGWVDKVIK
jgi:hypothetical protein